jgi:hypothetical protein
MVIVVHASVPPRMIPAVCSQNHSKSSHGAKRVGPTMLPTFDGVIPKYG